MIDEFKVIAIMNEAMIKTLKDKRENYDENLKIKKYLSDDALFFKLSKAQSYEILQKVGVQSKNIEEVYKKLISPSIFYNLLHCEKIKADDDNVIIKYDTYNRDDLFKKKSNIKKYN